MNEITRLGYMIGWRVWRLVYEPETDSFLLNSVFIHPDIWQPNSWKRAKCLYRRSEDRHKPPVEECECGLYAFKEPNRAYRLFANFTEPGDETIYSGFAWGEVACSGRIIEHEDGYRCELQYPLSFRAEPPLPRTRFQKVRAKEIEEKLYKRYSICQPAECLSQ